MELFKTGDWKLDSSKIAFQATDKPANNKEKKKNNNKKHKKERKDKQKKESKENVDDNDDKEETSLNKSNDLKGETKTGKDHKISKPSLNIAQPKKLTPLQQKMMAKLSGSRFRWINEQLYTTTSENALELIKNQPELFDEYHDGFRSQVVSWPENPIDVFIDQIKSRSTKPINAPGGLPGLPKTKELIIADMGCGEAALSLKVTQFFNKNKKLKRKIDYKVHSFDLKKVNDRITVADIKNVPLPDNSCSIVIFCLSLMGTNFLDFIKEAYRILAPRGELWIAEIKSRFSDNGHGDEFTNALKLMGFFHKQTDDHNKMFTRFEFFKPSQDVINERIAKLERRQKFIEVENEKEQLFSKREKKAEGEWLLKPCIYKRR